MEDHLKPPIAQLPKDGDAYPETVIEDDMEIVRVLGDYFNEADNNRKGGPNGRDAKWNQNLDLYWNRYNFGEKADWQAKESMPEVPGFVDRFAAAMKEALVASPDDFFTVDDPYDTEADMSNAIKSMMKVWLSASGRNQLGQTLGFPAVFEEQMKLGALMATASTVLWRKDVPHGRVAIEAVDPRTIWLDHTNRNLYRIRRVELDMADLLRMRKTEDSAGRPIFNIGAIEQALSSQTADSTSEKEDLTGHGQQVTSSRRPVILDEYVATVVSKDGRMLADNELMVVANNKYLIRGPEKNPYWHGKDWLVYAPLIVAPLSVYGRSYMEDFGDVAKVFNQLTNLILDAAQSAAINAFALVPGMLTNPEQALSGVSPNKTFLLEEGYRAEDFAKELQLGSLDPQVIQVWQSLKNELHEAAGINEVGLGQFAPKGRTSATEVGHAMQSGSAIVRSIAQTVEKRFLEPVLDLTWKTGLQNVDPMDPYMSSAVGPEMWQALVPRRKELITRPITFQAMGISALIQKSRMLQSLLQLLQIIASSQELLAAFTQEVDFQKLIALLFDLSNIDPKKLQATQRDQMIQSIVNPMLQGAEGPAPGGAAKSAVKGAVGAAGLTKGAGGY